MTKPSAEKKIGGEFGDVRAAIDVEKLNAYLEVHVPEITAPVTVKQFKVCVSKILLIGNAGLRLYCIQFGQVRSGNPFFRRFLTFTQSNPTYFLTDSKCVTRYIHRNGRVYCPCVIGAGSPFYGRNPPDSSSRPRLTKSSASTESSTLSTNTTSNPAHLQRNAYRYHNHTSCVRIMRSSGLRSTSWSS